MPQDRLMQAISRIERALVRLENIDVSQAGFPPEPSDLQQQYDRLKQEAQSALADIDRLISQAKG
jgi:hypothetical protein